MACRCGLGSRDLAHQFCRCAACHGMAGLAFWERFISRPVCRGLWSRSLLMRHGWMAPFALVGLAAGLALGGLACGCGWLGRRSSGAGRSVLVALGLVAAEAARAHLFTGFPWASIGHIWIGAPQAQLAALTGAGGLTLITCLAAALPAALGAQRTCWERCSELPCWRSLQLGAWCGLTFWHLMHRQTPPWCA